MNKQEEPLDSFTFGKSRAAVNLVSILNKPANVDWMYKASRILSKYSKEIKVLGCIPDKGVRETAFKLWRNRFIDRVNRCFFPTVIETHLKCVIVGIYRAAMRRDYNAN